MNDTMEKTEDFLDVDFGENNGGDDNETMPTGSYDLEIIDMTTKVKSDNKRRSDLIMKQREKPTYTLEQIDTHQWVFTFRVIDGDWAGEVLTENMTRSFHEKSNAGMLAAAALGLEKYDMNVARQMAEQAGVRGSKLLLGKRVRAFVVEKPDAQGRKWNNIKQFSSIPAPRTRQRPSAAPQAPVTPDPAVTLPDDFWPEEGTLQEA